MAHPPIRMDHFYRISRVYARATTNLSTIHFDGYAKSDNPSASLTHVFDVKQI
jgi:hypothetical protein